MKSPIWTQAFENILTNPDVDANSMSLAKLDQLLEREFAGIRLETLSLEEKEEEANELDQTILSLNQEQEKLKKELDHISLTSLSRTNTFLTKPHEESHSLNLTDSR